MKKKLIFVLIFVIMIVTALFFIFVDFEKGNDNALRVSVGTIEIDAVDDTRNADCLVLYTKNFERNQYGYEILVENKTGFVIDADDLVEIEEDTYILSGNGAAADFLRQVEMGDIVTISGKSVIVEKDMKYSPIKRLEIKKNRIDQIVQYRMNNLYDVDYEGISVTDKKLDEAFDDLSDYLKSKEVEERIIQQKTKSIDNLLEQKYYSSIESDAIEGRGIWHRPNHSGIDESNIEGVKQFVSRLCELGVNMLYVETYWHGMTTYYSEVLSSQHPSMASFDYGEYGSDYILALISECHKKGIEVHAWVELANVGVSKWKLPSHIKEEWLSVEPVNSTRRYLDVANGEVVDYLCSIMEEMLQKYDFDGISYDYVRYGEYSQSLIATTDEMKVKAVTDLVKKLSEKIRSINKNIIISSSPYGYLDQALELYKQDVRCWLENGYLDVVLPMIYTENSELLESTINDYEAYNGRVIHYIGISPLYNGATLMRNQELIDVINQCNVGGFALFASQNYITRDPEYRESIQTAMSNSATRTPAITPTSNVYEVLDVWCDQLVRRYEKLYSDHMNDEEKRAFVAFCNSLSESCKEKQCPSKIMLLIEEYELDIMGATNRAVSERICYQTKRICDILNFANVRYQ